MRSGAVFVVLFGLAPGEQLLVGPIPPVLSVALGSYRSLHGPLASHGFLLAEKTPSQFQQNRRGMTESGEPAGTNSGVTERGEPDKIYHL